MSFPQKTTFFSEQKKNIGGTQNVPPTPCRRPAYVAVYAPAHVERTGQPKQGAKHQVGRTGQVVQITPILRWRPAA